MILLETMLEVVIGVMVMEVNKVADEVTDMEVDKVAGQENVEFFHIPSFFNLWLLPLCLHFPYISSSYF